MKRNAATTNLVPLSAIASAKNGGDVVILHARCRVAEVHEPTFVRLQDASGHIEAVVTHEGTRIMASARVLLGADVVATVMRMPDGRTRLMHCRTPDDFAMWEASRGAPGSIDDAADAWLGCTIG